MSVIDVQFGQQRGRQLTPEKVIIANVGFPKSCRLWLGTAGEGWENDL